MDVIGKALGTTRSVTESGAASGSGPVLVSVVVPTRNEAERVAEFAARLCRALEGTTYEIVFVDDSNDGTELVLESLASDYSGLTVLHRGPGERRGGLAGAVVLGFEAAQGTYVAVMDADFQHPPGLLPEMLGVAERRGINLVIASRYVPGGSAQGLGDRRRRVISLATALFVRSLFFRRLWRVKDPGSGYFLVRASLLRDAELRPLGYKILLELLVRLPWRTFAEIPYRFAEREGGASKASLREGLLFLRHSARLFWEVSLSRGPRARGG
jgi:dolichol-phosphate mannosyltransferase